MSETPKTDAAVEAEKTEIRAPDEYVPADFARQLERELNALYQQRDLLIARASQQEKLLDASEKANKQMRDALKVVDKEATLFLREAGLHIEAGNLHSLCYEALSTTAGQDYVHKDELAAANGCVAELKKERDEARAQVTALREALQTLVDEQNGAPLLRREEQWRAAMVAARRLLDDTAAKREAKNETPPPSSSPSPNE